MQNRIVLSNIPAIVPKLPNSLDALRDVLEDHGCWVDRIAYLPEGNAIVAEFHIENVRDLAIQSLNQNNQNILLNNHGDLCSQNGNISFIPCASAATKRQSQFLLDQCPMKNQDDEKNPQILRLPYNIEIAVHHSEELAGTGSDPWRGGVILAQHIVKWYEMEQLVEADGDVVSFESLFRSKRILELGAGSSGLPSMALAKLCCRFDYPIENLIASDGIDEIVTALQNNIAHNDLEGTIDVKHIQWGSIATDQDNMRKSVDTIIFSDCIYNEEGAKVLCEACVFAADTNSSNCNVIGVLPDFRVGVDLFEGRMKQSGFLPVQLPMLKEESKHNHGKFACSGGAGTHYRILLWRKRQQHHNTKLQNKESCE